MLSELPLFPEAASTIARGVDLLYLFLTSVTAFFSTLIFVCIFVFAVKYRRSPKNPGPEAVHGNLGLELLWTAVPFGITMIMFTWGASLYISDARVPPERVGHLCGWATVDVEDSASGRSSRDQRTSYSGWSTCQADACVSGRHSQFLHSSLSPEAGCRAGPLHNDVV